MIDRLSGLQQCELDRLLITARYTEHTVEVVDARDGYTRVTLRRGFTLTNFYWHDDGYWRRGPVEWKFRKR